MRTSNVVQLHKRDTQASGAKQEIIVREETQPEYTWALIIRLGQSYLPIALGSQCGSQCSPVPAASATPDSLLKMLIIGLPFRSTERETERKSYVFQQVLQLFCVLTET